MLRHIIFFIASIVLFLGGMILYGVALNVREVSLEESMRQKGLTEIINANLVVRRDSYQLELYSDTVFVKSYRAYFGKDQSPRKIGDSDGKTPIGSYRVCDLVDDYKYEKLIRINFPNKSDADEAKKSGLITEDEYDNIIRSLLLNVCPEYERDDFIMGIHGNGRLDFLLKNLPFVFNWTTGTIAVDNKTIEELFKIIEEGDKVVIKN